jgi:DNA adenine methylase
VSTGTVIGYYGSKVRAAARIIDLFPPHLSYVEPFCGSLAVLLAKPRSKRFETVNDLDGDLMTFWRVLRNQVADLERLCALTPHSRAELDDSWPIGDDVDDLERARRVWVRLSQGRGGHLLSTGWRYHEQPHGRNGTMPRTLQNYVGRFAAVADRLRDVSLECRPALEVIDRYGRDPDTLIYADPPYLLSTRARKGYRHELHTETEHRDLAGALHQVRATVVISGYPSPLYDELYGSWHRTDLSAFTGQGNADGARTEVLWSNQQLGSNGLFDLGEGA